MQNSPMPEGPDQWLCMALSTVKKSTKHAFRGGWCNTGSSKLFPSGNSFYNSARSTAKKCKHVFHSERLPPSGSIPCTWLHVLCFPTVSSTAGVFTPPSLHRSVMCHSAMVESCRATKPWGPTVFLGGHHHVCSVSPTQTSPRDLERGDMLLRGTQWCSLS